MKEIEDITGKFIPKLWEKALVDNLTNNLVLADRFKPHHYKKMKVNRWFSIPYLVFESYTCDECQHKHRYFSVEWLKLFKLGKKTELVPVYKKTGGVIKFRKYSTPLPTPTLKRSKIS